MKVNCHCHIFSLDCLPLESRQRFVLDVKNPIHRLVHRLLRIILPDDSNLQAWIDLLDLSISGIAHRLVQEMDEVGIGISTPLMMDMEFCKRFACPPSLSLRRGRRGAVQKTSRTRQPKPLRRWKTSIGNMEGPAVSIHWG